MGLLLQKQVAFAKAITALKQQMVDAGQAFKVGEGLRTDEQAAINALKEDGRLALSIFLEGDPRFHALALAVKNNGKGWGILASVHCLGLAEDIILVDAAGDVDWAPDSYRKWGEVWKGMSPYARWGGDFRDFDHFSFEHEGVK